MAFQSTQPVQVVVCPSCSGKGCSECGNFGVYGLGGDKTLIFTLPSFLNIEKRLQVKKIYLAKRVVVLVIFLLLIAIAWSFINKI